MSQITSDVFQLTAHGEALRSFCREYVVAHPRLWTWRDCTPDIAVVRFDDSCHGQRFAGSDTLFGSPLLASDADTEAWLHIWNLLTWGTTGTDGLTFFKQRVASAGSGRSPQPGEHPSLHARPAQAARHPFFVPLSGTVVFDETVGYDRLAGIPLIFLTGKELSDETVAAARRCVADGAVCIVWGPLSARVGLGAWTGELREHPHGAGRFLVTADYESPAVRGAVAPWLGHPDVISYRFGAHRVTLRRATDNTVTEHVASA